MSNNSLPRGPAPQRQINSEFFPVVFRSKLSLLFSFIVCSLAVAVLFTPNSQAAEVEFTGPRPGEYLVAEEMRFLPILVSTTTKSAL